jgi:homogentisate 1,2-dioxygenase
MCFYGVQSTIARGNNVGPQKIIDTMAFMFESSLIPRITRSALESPFLDHDYYQCWIGLRSHFTVPEQKTIKTEE